MIFLRSVLFYIFWTLWTCLMGVISIFFIPLPRSVALKFGRFWAKGTLFLLRILTGIEHEVRGTENIVPGTAIYAVKHQSTWETLALTLEIPPFAGVLKRELLLIPVYGWFLRKTGMVPIDRSAGSSALRSMLKQAKRFTEEGRNIMIMPEGTRMPPGRTGRYHSGIAALYKHLDLPVVPVALNSGLFWRRRGFQKYPGTITMWFLPPIPPGENRADFMKRLETAIEEASETLRLEVVGKDGAPLPK